MALWPAGPNLLGWSGVGVGYSGAAVREGVAFAVHLKDVDMVGKSVGKRTGQPLGPERPGPFIDWQVAGDKRGTAFVKL